MQERDDLCSLFELSFGDTIRLEVALDELHNKKLNTGAIKD